MRALGFREVALRPPECLRRDVGTGGEARRELDRRLAPVLPQAEDPEAGALLESGPLLLGFGDRGIECMPRRERSGGAQVVIVVDDVTLPETHTCTRELHLPNYSCAAIMREKLLQALDHAADGFQKQ